MSKLNRAFIRAYTQKPSPVQPAIEQVSLEQPAAATEFRRIDTLAASTVEAPNFWCTSISTFDSTDSLQPPSTIEAASDREAIPDGRTIQLSSFDDTLAPIIARIDHPHPSSPTPTQHSPGATAVMAGSDGTDAPEPIREKLSAYRERTRLVNQQLHQSATLHSTNTPEPSVAPELPNVAPELPRVEPDAISGIQQTTDKSIEMLDRSTMPVQSVLAPAAESTVSIEPEKVPAIDSFNRIAQLIDEQAAIENDAPPNPTSDSANSKSGDDDAADASDANCGFFQSAWEVDQLNWPEITNELCSSEQTTLDEVCQHLIDANETGLQVLAVTSLESGRGGSTVAMCLARSVAKTGMKVALIDADPNGQSLADAFNLDVEQGWLDCIARNISFEESAVQAIDDSVTVFPLSGLTAQSRLTLDSFRLQSVIDKLKLHFDFLVVDGQKLADRACVLVDSKIGRSVDAAIIVTDGEESLSTGIDSSVEQLQACKISSVGIVENFIASTTA